MSTPAAGPWQKYATERGPWEKYQVPEETAAPPPLTSRKYLPGREFGMNVARGMGLDVEKIAAAEEAGGQLSGAGEIGRQALTGLGRFAGSVLKDPFRIVDPLHAMASSVETAIKEKSPGQFLGASAAILGGAEGVTKAPGVVRAAARPVVAATEAARTVIPSRLINSVLRTPKAGYRFGKNPGLAVAQEGIAANSEVGLLSAIKAKAGEIETARNALLAKAQATPINVHQVIKNTLGPEIDNARQIGNRAGAEALRNLAIDLQNEHPRLMSPAEATKFKSQLGRATNWTTDSTQMILNDGRRRLYGRLRFEIEMKVPKVGPLNERWGNMLEAEKALENAMAIAERRGFATVTDLAAVTAGGLLLGEPFTGGVTGLAVRKGLQLAEIPGKTRISRTLARKLPGP